MSTAAEAPCAERRRARLRRLALKRVRYELQFTDERPTGRRLCFLLETQRVEYRWVLEDVCARESWPLPIDVAKAASSSTNRASRCVSRPSDSTGSRRAWVSCYGRN